MRRSLHSLFALAQVTARETVRHPLACLLTVLCLACSGYLPLLLAFQMGEPGKLARDGAMAFHLMFGLLLGSIAAGSTFSRELERGTAAGLLSMGVPRGLFLAGKYLGVLTVLLAFSWCAGITTLLAERAAPRFFVQDSVAGLAFSGALAAGLAGGAYLNFRYRRSFSGAVFGCLCVTLPVALACVASRGPDGQPVAWGSHLQWSLVPASGMITLCLAILSALSLALATRLPTAFLTTSTLLVFAVGLLHPTLFGSRAPAILRFLGRALIPDWQLFWMADSIGTGGVPVRYLLLALAYTLLFSTGFLLLAVLAFRSREFD